MPSPRPLFAALLFALPLSAQPAPVESFSPARIRLLESPFRQIQELHRTGLLGRLDPDRLLVPFRRTAGLPQPPGIDKGYGGWDDGFLAGHFAAHYLSAASRMYAATGDTSFRLKVDHIVKVLAECQQRLGGGYLSGFPLARFDKLEASPKDAGVEYYTIHKILSGLLDASVYCKNPQALPIAARLADFLSARVAKLSPAQLEAMLRTDYAPNPHNEFGGIAEALEDLYRLSQLQGDPNAVRHLQFAAVFHRDWFLNALLSGPDRLDGLHANTHIPQAASFARYAQLTGDPRTARAADTFWNWVVRGHSFVNGSHGFNEKFRAAGVEVAGAGEAALGPLTGETCGTYNMLRLSRLQFERAPAAAIGDYIENGLYNHILASISPETGRVVYFTPLRPGDFRTYIDEPYCCLGTGIENAARFNDAIYFHRRNALWVNLYIPSTLDWSEQGLKLRLETRYPESGAIRLTVDAQAPVTALLNLRIPAWLQGKPAVKLNGRPFPANPVPGRFLSIARPWKAGDVLELDLPLALRQRKAADDPATVSFFYGPVLLAAKLGREGMPPTDVSANTGNAKLPAWPVPVLTGEALQPKPGVPLAFTARALNPKDKTPLSLDLAPLYQVHHQRYAVYWKLPKPVQANPRQ